jgi:hypothetical protein
VLGLFKFAYDESMKISMAILGVIAHVREKAVALVKVINRLFRTSQGRSGADAEEWIAEFERLSGSGHSDGWRFDRDEIHQRR